MGYSCTMIADFSLKALFEILKNPDEKSSNVFYDKNNNKYFYEIGRENSDGSITGTIHKFIENEMCIKYGSFKINSDGVIERFSISTKEQRIEARAKALIDFQKHTGQIYSEG